MKKGSKILILIALLSSSFIISAEPYFDVERNNELRFLVQRKVTDEHIKELKEFIKEWEKENKDDPGLIFAKYSLYAVNEKTIKKAEKVLFDGIEKYPNMVDIYTNLTEFYTFRYEFDKAADILNKAIDLIDENDGIYLGRDLVNIDYGSYEANVDLMWQTVLHFSDMWLEAYYRWGMSEVFKPAQSILENILSKTKTEDKEQMARYNYFVGTRLKFTDLDKSCHYLEEAYKTVSEDEKLDVIYELALNGHLRGDEKYENKWFKKLEESGDEELIDIYLHEVHK